MKVIIDREFDNFNALKENTYGQKIVLTYQAKLNDRAAADTGRPGFENDVRLEFSNNPDHDSEGSTGYTPWDTVVCFTYKLNVYKTNNHEGISDLMQKQGIVRGKRKTSVLERLYNKKCEVAKKLGRPLPKFGQ